MTPTIKARIRAALLAGERLTPLDAWARFGTSRLAALIHQLRREGMRIDTEEVVVDCADGHQARVARYSLAEGAD